MTAAVALPMAIQAGMQLFGSSRGGMRQISSGPSPSEIAAEKLEGIKRRASRGSTILTGGLGLTETAPTKKRLLGE